MGAPQAAALAQPPVDIRHGVREALISAAGFERLQAADRREIAHALVRIAHAAKLLEEESGVRAGPATPVVARALNAGDELSGTAVDRMAGTTRRMINAISFPRFVNELITGVFRAMLETNQQQLQQYLELVRGVSQSLDGFSSLAGDDNMARRWLAERFPQSFRLEEPDPDDVPDPDDDPEPLRLISIGSPPAAEALRAALSLEADAEVPSGGAEALVPFARRALARNRQQMLATMIQLGMQRIVIDSGRITAGMRFHIDASSAAAEDRSSRFDTRHSVSASGSFGWGPWSASAAVSSTIGYVSTTDVRTREELNASADLNSSVELHFRTDQVPLDRIASQQTTERLRLNTLNPERELDIARQADEARLTNRRALEATYASRPRLEAAAPAAPAASSPPSPGGAGGAAAGRAPAATPGAPAVAPGASAAGPAAPAAAPSAPAAAPGAPAVVPGAPAAAPGGAVATPGPSAPPAPGSAAPAPTPSPSAATTPAAGPGGAATSPAPVRPAPAPAVRR